MSRRDDRGHPVNAVAWLIWLVGVAAIPLVSRHPLYLLLAIVVVMLVFLSLPRRDGTSRAWRLFAYAGSAVATLSIGFNVLTVHVGDRVFARLPGWLPIVGGPLTVNALLYGVASAMAIATLLFAAATFNTAVRHGDLVRILPSSVSHLGVAGGIAIAFVPQTIAAGRDIYDAQRARGHQFRGVRNARGLVVPLLATGLERAMVLSEALETRGFGAPASVESLPGYRSWLFGGAVVSMILALPLLATGRLLAGFLALLTATVLAMAGAPRRSVRTRYRETRWNRASITVAAAGLCPVAVLIAHLATGFSLGYEPFPRLEAPEFSPIAGLAIVALIAPAVWSQS